MIFLCASHMFHGIGTVIMVIADICILIAILVNIHHIYVCITNSSVSVYGSVYTRVYEVNPFLHFSM